MSAGIVHKVIAFEALLSARRHLKKVRQDDYDYLILEISILLSRITDLDGDAIELFLKERENNE